MRSKNPFLWGALSTILVSGLVVTIVSLFKKDNREEKVEMPIDIELSQERMENHE